MIFRQLFDQTSSTYTYLLADETTREAVIIDPVYEQSRRDTALIHELDLKLLYTLDTHCHADHVTGSWLMRHHTGCKIACAKVIGAENTDTALIHGDKIRFGHCSLSARATPGHTDGCISFVTEDQTMVFTGDALLIRGCGRSDFQQGSPHRLYHSIKEQIFTLPDDCAVYPGHDYAGRTSSTVAEEKQYNPRLGGSANEDDFVGYMSAMQLPHPKHLAVALPANMRCGMPENGEIPAEPDWAPVTNTFAGFSEISPDWVARNRQAVHILDVRNEQEIAVDHGTIVGSQLIPLDSLRDRISEIPSEKPVVTLCRSGRRSALAVGILQNAGFERVANVAGGMLRWQEEGLSLQ
ncbi:MAG: MBL fold metallo-hydrolase [Porticoccaceae bacterium]|nr:MBL fold metallo-hydrolase [Pseudomonadales bacterium]MCP5171953.1 MBL fold metallo-hydrolase [Pseudomonadales bacterium]